MDATTIDFLRQVNNDFYARCAASFSATRNAAWVGWRTCSDVAQDCGALRSSDSANGCSRDDASLHTRDDAGRQSYDGALVQPCDGSDARSCDGATAQPLTNRESACVRVLDAACGNMRFAAFLRETLPDRSVDYYAVDDCDGLVPELPSGKAFSTRFQSVDIIGELEAGANLADVIACEARDFVGCFGFLHHVPSFELRARLIDALLQKVVMGGVVCLSFWQFMRDEKFGKKAQAWNAAAVEELCAAGLDAAQLEAGDYFLGWQSEPGLWRYCHSFEEGEIDALVAAACEGGEAREVARFSADGKSGVMNRYVVLRKR